ncbi:hypothetical protein EV715DRAFT_211313 [Schizophyllum commune]
MKLSLAVILAVVTTSVLAVPLFEPCLRNDDRELLMRRRIRRSAVKPLDATEKDRSTGRRGQSPNQQKRSEVVESREEGAIKYPTWTKEDKRTDDSHWAGANWSLEDKRTTEEHALAHQWGYEDVRVLILPSVSSFEARSARHVLVLIASSALGRPD